MGAGLYTIKVIGELDSTRIRAELARLSKTPLKVNGALVGVGTNAGKATKGVKGLNGAIAQTNKQTQKSAGHMKKFGSETLNVTKKVIQFGAITAVIRGVTSGMGDMVKNVYDLDKALTEFKKVSDLTGKGLDEYTDKAYKVGKTVARTGTEMIEAATEFKKSGFSEKDSLELGRVASMYQNVADVELSAGEAANFIVSQMKAFNLTADDSEHIIDAVNEVSNNFAVSSADIATNIGKASAAMATGNVTYEQSIGLMTAMTEITRNGAKSARGLVSIQSRYNQIVDESSSTGKKLTAWYKEHNIAIKDQNGQLRSFYEVGADVAKIWDTLDDNEKRYYLNTQAGANQSQNLAALMRNYGTAIEATNTALDSAGSAAKENGRYMESMEGKLEGLASAWEDFSRKMVNSDVLKKGIDVLTKVLEALSSDVGQIIIKYGLMFAGIATGLNLVAKAALGIKSLSLVKLFSGFATGSKKATNGLKIMQGAQVGATKAATPLYGAFGKLTGSLLGSTGLVAGIALLSVALAEYIPIGEKARDIKLGKELKEAQSDVENTEKKYKSLRDELDKLHEKEKEGTLTNSEQNRLTILENQTKQYERQLELKKQIAVGKADEYYHTVDPSKLEGRAKDKYTLAKSAGKSDKEALAAAGINDKIALSLNNVRARADEVTKAQEKVTEAYEHNGKESKQYKDSLENLDKAEKKQGDVLAQLQKLRKKAIEDYGSEKKANKALGESWKELNKEISSLKVLKGLNFKKPSKDIAKLKKNAKSLGLEFDKSGKKINNIDLKTFSQKMTEAGYSVEDTWDYIKKLSKENPNIKVNIDGTDVAVKDLEFVDGKIQKIGKEKPKAVVDINAKDNASAKMKKIKANKNLGKAEKKLEEKGSKTLNAKINKLKNVKGLGQARKDIAEHGSIQVNQKLKNIKNQKGLGTSTKTINQNGYDSVKNKLDTLGSKSSLGTATKTINFSLSGAVAAGKKFFGFKSGVKHFASGGKSGILDNAEVNEQGFEIIQDGKTGLMRVANGGKRGTTRINKGDSVYTHGQSVRMLQQSGMTENKVIHGHQNEDFALFGVNKLPGYKKGLSQSAYNKKYNKLVATFTKKLKKLESKRDKKNWSNKKFQSEYSKLYKDYQKKLKKLNKKKVQDKVERKTSKEYRKKLTKRKKQQDKAYKKKRQKRYNKRYNALIDKYDAELATLEYKRETQHWSDKAFNKKYKALKNKYNKKLKNLNKNKSIKGAKTKKSIGLDRLRAYGSAVAQTKSEAAKASIENYINGKRLTYEELKSVLKSIKKQRKAKKISAQEADAYRKEAYKKNVEYNLKAYKNDKKTYASMLKLLKKRYNDGKITAEEYYEYLDDLAQTQLEKEKERITERQTLNDNTYNLAKNYVQRQIDLLEEENEEQEEQNELIELQNNLAKARNQRIRIYKEGEGFVYEQDTEAIREATDALKEYQKTNKGENPVLAQWKEVLKLFDEYEADATLKALEVQVGSTVAKLFGSMGTNTNAWAKWIKNSLATTQGLQNVLDGMDKLTDTDAILKYLNSEGKVADSIINAAIKNNKLPKTYAAAITQSALNSQMVANQALGLTTQSSISALTSGAIVNGNSTQYGNIYNFESLVLPNVTNATQFINELNNLTNTALQATTQRV